MKKLFLLTAVFCGSLINANAEYKLSSLEEAAWKNLSTIETDYFDNNYVDEWGKLQLVGNQLCSDYGNPIQLRGWSTYSINYDDVVPCLSESGFDAMKAWGANIVRLAIYPKNSAGAYSSETDTTIEKYIQYANNRHMYVLLDWHVSADDTNSGDPSTYKSQAKQMFTNITKWITTNGYKNVLYEICNECSQSSSETDITWTDIKDYANEILPIIESNDPGAIVIIGTPQKSQEISEAINHPIVASNYNLRLMYAFHYYACSNHESLGDLQRAAATLPCFVSQWSSGSDTLGSKVCEESSDALLTALQPEGNNGNQLISWCYWAWGKNEEAMNSLSKNSPDFVRASLTESGNYIVSIMIGDTFIPEPGALTYYATQDIPTDDQNKGILNIGYFDYGGEGVAYHDILSNDPSEDPSNENYKCGNTGATYSGETDLTSCFRYDENVDISSNCAGLGANGEEPGDGFGNTKENLHYLSGTEPGEWMLYHINVKKAGYYTVKCLTNSGTSSKGTIGMAIVKGHIPNQNGNILRRWSDHENEQALKENPLVSFALNATPSCGLEFDGSINEDGATNGSKSEDRTCWGWNDCGTTDADKEDLTVLFKYTGEQELQITISPDSEYSPNDFSNFAFTFKSAEIPNFEIGMGSVENEGNDLSEFAIAPNPTDGHFTIKVDGKTNVTITNLMGVEVFNGVIEGPATINKKLANGIYIVRVGDKTKKLIVK